MSLGAQIHPRVSLSPLSAMGILFVVYALVSIAWSTGGQLFALGWLASMVVAYVLGQWCEDRVWFWYIVLAPILILLPINPNYIGCFLAVGFAAAIAYEFWFALPFYCFGFWYAQSRGALVAAGIVGLVGLWRYSRFWAVTLILLSALLIVSQKPESIMPIANRLGVWQDTMNHLVPFGHGYGSFFATYSAFPVRTNMTLELAPHAYNDYLELISDLGIGAAFLWLFILLAFENQNYRAKLILLSYAALALTYFPLWILIVGQLFAFTLGNLTSGRIVKPNRRLSW